jgi:antitoxin component of MazEF toxin-antitoxin module
MEVTVKKIDGKLVAEIPSEALEQLGALEGEKLEIDSNDDRLSIQKVRNMHAHAVMDEHDAVLSKLAASERMDRVDAIMDRYDEALTELAK